MKVQDDNHFMVTWLENRVPNIVIQDVDLVSSHRCVAETYEKDLVRLRKNILHRRHTRNVITKGQLLQFFYKFGSLPKCQKIYIRAV